MSKGEKTKLNILEAAENEFSEKGLYGARVDEIARLANINKRMIYEYFGNKEELYKAVLIDVYRRLGELEVVTLSSSPSTGMDCVEAIKSVIELYYKFLASNPSFINMIMWENLNKAQYLKEVNALNSKDLAVKLIRQVISQGKSEGVFKEEIDEEQVILSLITFSFSYFSNIHTLSYVLKTDMASEENIEKRVKHVTDLILNYIMV